MKIISAILALRDIFKWVGELITLLRAKQEQDKQDKLEKALDEGDTKSAEEAIDSSNAGKPSNLPGVQVRKRRDRSKPI